MDIDTLRARGDRDLATILMKDPLVRRAAEKQKQDPVHETRRYLLGTAVRLTASMAPEIHRVAQHCKDTLEVKEPLEIYVAPNPYFNAFSYGGESGRVFVGITSSLVEAFDSDELSFVMGHELGHHMFGHHDIPIGVLFRGQSEIRPEQAIQLFQWQRYAEISCDRAGLACAGDMDSTARAFFKMASGLRGAGITFEIDEYIRQIGDIEAEAAKARQGKELPRGDWFASHPFSPLRVRAAQLCATSILNGGSLTIDELESQVQDLMSLMDPSYLMDKSDTGEAMRRLLLAGGVLVAAASGEIEDSEIEALERFLGERSLPSELSPEALRDNLDQRVAFAKQHVPVLKLAQVIRDLCVIAVADGRADDDELAIIRDLAAQLGVEKRIIDQTIDAALSGLD